MILKGKGVCAGYSWGQVTVYKRIEDKVVRKRVRDAEAEVVRYHEARAVAKEQFEKLYEKALLEVGNNNASLFKADIVMLDDTEYIESVQNIIRSQKVNAEYAVAVTIDNFSKMMLSLDDDYIKDRAGDIRDVFNKVIHILSKNSKETEEYDKPVILFAQDLTPSDIVRINKDNIVGIVMAENNNNSHTAILSRSLNIPSVSNVDLYLANEIEGKMAIVDGYSGTVIIDPSEEDIKLYERREQLAKKKEELLKALKGKETITMSGRKIDLYANINDEKDVATALSNDAEGAGLYRSEYLFMGKDIMPSEEEQLATYRMIAENMGGKKVVIRTADIGADKRVNFIENDFEENPALGYRGIRISLDKKEFFEVQLRAIYRASYYGNISIMFPMITSLEEVVQVKNIIASVKKDLEEEGYPYKDCEIGIMIETPAAVMISDLLAKEVDFFSIGTNDLSQYTLAVDRTNAKIEKYYNPRHEAILRMIKMTIDNAKAANCRVGICGEMASDPEIVPKLVEYGIDEISVLPVNLLSVREIIRSMK